MISIILILFAGWEIQNSTVSIDLNGVCCVNDQKCWVVGCSGTILFTSNSGQTWSVQNSGTNEDLFGVSFVDDMNGWAVGYGPTILHTTNGGNTWLPQTAGTSNNLLNVVFVNANRGWATGVTGTIIGTNNGGLNWSSEISGQWAWLWGVTAVSTGSAWAVGADWFNHIAPVYNYNGSQWQQQFEITNTQDGKSIAAINANTVWAVGGNGSIYYTSNGGSTWSSQTSTTNLTLWDVAPVSETKCWAIGSSGLILNTVNSGNQWSQQTCPVNDSLFGIAMFDDYTGWITGENGRILYTNNGGYGIQEFNQAIPLTIDLFPNPASSMLHITFPANADGLASLKLYNACGAYICALDHGAMQSQLDFSIKDLNPGTYFLHIDISGLRTIKRFVVIR